MARSKQAVRARTGKPVRPSAGSRRVGWVQATGLVTAFVIGFAAAFLIVSPLGGADAIERRTAELQQEQERADLVQVGVLTELATGTRDRLAPVLAAMSEVAPIGDGDVKQASAGVVRGWREVVSAEAERYAETPSAGNGVNVARTAMRTSVEQLAAAVDAFDAAAAAPEPLKGRLLALAGEQRTLALRTWSAAALQLDVINVEAGNGHVHVYLPAGPDSGAIAPDSVPEGSGGG
ncbi:hypothetical protein ACTG9Q_14260 [Actinokineospora sp. 24-640]